MKSFGAHSEIKSTVYTELPLEIAVVVDVVDTIYATFFVKCSAHSLVGSKGLFDIHGHHWF